MNWRNTSKQKPSLNERIYLFYDDVIWSGRYVSEESMFGGRFALHYYFLLDNFDRQEFLFSNKRHRIHESLLKWWLPYSEMQHPQEESQAKNGLEE